jgi:FkbH-like protein
MSTAYKAAVYSTFTARQFARLLEGDEGPPPIAVSAVHELLPGSAFSRRGAAPESEADIAVVITTPESVLPSVAGLLAGLPCDAAAMQREVDEFAAAIVALPARLVFAYSWIAPPRFSGGVLALDARFGLDGVLAAANLHLVQALKEHSACTVLNAGHWQGALGARAFNAKNWYLTRDPFSFEAWKMAVADLKTALAACTGRAKKLLVLDLDNTLWGGEVGDSGVEGLRLGAPDLAGAAHQEFQRELRALARRGVVLAIASKNDEDLALSAIDTHPEMILQRTDFADWAIDWEEKGPNIRALCERIGISPADAVFIDDNPAERRAVALELPELTVPEWPANPLLYVEALRSLSVFDVPEVSAEDLGRSRSYAAARALREAGEPPPLETRVDIRALEPSDVGRTVQLLNKTNQFNLTTRRLTEPELRAWLESGSRTLHTVRVADAFADYGLTGVLSLEFEPPVCRIVDFAMSCRVLARGVEERMVQIAAEEARAHGCERLEARFLPTERNEPMRRFLVERSGLEAGADGAFSLNVRSASVQA